MIKLLKGTLLFAVIFLAGESHAAGMCSATAQCTTGMYHFTSAASTNTVTLYTAGGNGAEVLAIFCTAPATLTGANLLNVYETHSSVPYLLGQPTIPSAYGQAGVPTPNILLTTAFGAATSVFSQLPTDAFGNVFILLAAGDSLQLKLGTALVGSDALDCNAQVIQY